MKKINLNIVLVIITIMIGMTLVWIRVGEYLKITAVQGCMEVSTYTFIDVKTGVTTSEPMDQSIDKCLKRKGY